MIAKIAEFAEISVSYKKTEIAETRENVRLGLIAKNC